MNGLLLDRGEPYYSHFAQVFTQIGALSCQFQWLISHTECYPATQEFQNRFRGTYCWISGQDLADMLRKEDFQWIWGVLSGFDKNLSLEEVLRYPLPYADGYGGFWRNPLTLQHPLADIEITAWDSTYSIFIGKDDRILAQIAAIYPQAVDLEQYNNS